MTASAPEIEIITALHGRSLWDETLTRYAAACRDRLGLLPCWVVADGRHRRAAEIGLLRAAGRKAVPTGGICTLASLAGDILVWPVQNALASASVATFALEEILAEGPPEAYRQSSDKPGFAPAFWCALEDAESRGHFPEESLPGAAGPEPPPEFVALQRRLHQQLERRHLCTPAEFLRRALRKLEDPSSSFRIASPIFIGPWLNVSPLDKAFMAALIKRSDQVFLAPAGGISVADLVPQDLSDLFSDTAMQSPAAQSAEMFFLRPRTSEGELDAIFAIIARWAAEGRFRYRDVRMVHPFAHEGLPRLQAAARRYRVPVKLSFKRPLSQFPGVILLLKMLDLFESDWRRQHLLDLLRSRAIAAPIAEKSRLVERVLRMPDPRSRPPWSAWLAAAQRDIAIQLVQELTQLKDLDERSRAPQTAAAFASLIRDLADFVRAASASEPRSGEDEWAPNEENAGWKSLESLLEELCCGICKAAPRSRFVEMFKCAVNSAGYDVADKRRDAVEICPGHLEDHLPAPVVIYPALHSRVPSPRRPSAFLTSETSQRYDDQLRLFNLQIGNAREFVVLSCPQYDDEGDELALSPFLSSFLQRGNDRKKSARLLEQAQSWQPHQALKGDFAEMLADSSQQTGARAVRKASLQVLKQTSRRWSPTRLENAIQCLYLHFASNILQLEPQADIVAEAVTPPLLGLIAHKALHKYVLTKIQGQSFNLEEWAMNRFQQEIARFEPHPEVDRAGAELARCLAQFAALGWEKLAADFVPQVDRLELAFGEGRDLPPLSISTPSGEFIVDGVIDRLDQSPDGRALLIEYKYRKSDVETKDEFFKALREGEQPQLPIYWMAAERLLSLKPVALLQIYLRSAVIRSLKLPELTLLSEDAQAGDLTEEEVEQMRKNIISCLTTKASEISCGVITPKPRDFGRCGPGNCPYADLCRFRGKLYHP